MVEEPWGRGGQERGVSEGFYGALQQSEARATAGSVLGCWVGHVDSGSGEWPCLATRCWPQLHGMQCAQLHCTVLHAVL